MNTGKQGISNHHENEETFHAKPGVGKSLNANARLHSNRVLESVTVDSGGRGSNGKVITCDKRRIVYRRRKG